MTCADTWTVSHQRLQSDICPGVLHARVYTQRPRLVPGPTVFDLGGGGYDPFGRLWDSMSFYLSLSRVSGSSRRVREVSSEAGGPVLEVSGSSRRVREVSSEAGRSG